MQPETREHATSRPTLNADPVTPRWVACAAREFGPVGETRHLAAPGALTTVCGASASHSDIWRGNTRKPKCRECESHENSTASR